MLQVHFFTAAVFSFFAAIGFIHFFRTLLGWNQKAKREHEKLKAFYNGMPKAGRRNILNSFDETERFYHN